MEEVNWGKVKLENEIQILMEEIECVHYYLDDKLVPRQNDNGKDYSIIGRINRLEERFQKLLSELESNYLTITNQSKMGKTAIEKSKELIATFGKEIAPKVVDEMIGECRQWLTSDKGKRVHWEGERLDYLAEVKQELIKQKWGTEKKF